MKIAGETFTVQDLATKRAREYADRTSAKPRKIEAFRDGYLAGFADATRRGPELLNTQKRALEKSIIAAIRSFNLKGRDDDGSD